MGQRFGEILMEARRNRKISLRKLGQLTNIPASVLSEMENGKRLPPKDEDRIRDLALVLNVDTDGLLSSARAVRVAKNPPIMEKLFKNNTDLAWGLCRAAEKATDDELQEAINIALKHLNKEAK